MNPQIKARWVAALRSGEYKQGREVLHRRDESGESFCCLGVLCDLAHREGVVTRDDETLARYDEAWTILPDVVVDWADLPDYNPDVTNVDGEHSNLASENDAGRTFGEIADLIEAQL